MNPAPPRLTEAGCAQRRARLLELLERRRLDAALLTDPRDVYYLTGALTPSDLPVALVVAADGAVLLAAPAGTCTTDSATLVEFEWNLRGTRHPDLTERLAATLRDQAPRRPRQRWGLGSAATPDAVAAAVAGSSAAEFEPIDADLAALQSRKDPDEVAILRGSIRANVAAYAAAQAAIRPGATELEVLAAGWQGAMLAAGEKVFHDGDYQCGVYNGPARDRPIEAGELYIIDAWTCYRGYWADMSRTFCVGRAPSDFQATLYEHVRQVLRGAEELLRPGVDGREVYRFLDEQLRKLEPLAADGLTHHGGHAIGLRSHELPDVNPDRGGALEPGNILCLEPGGYVPEARLGVRLENMYLITDDGCERLCPEIPELIVAG